MYYNLARKATGWLISKFAPRSKGVTYTNFVILTVRHEMFPNWSWWLWNLVWKTIYPSFVAHLEVHTYWKYHFIGSWTKIICEANNTSLQFALPLGCWHTCNVDMMIHNHCQHHHIQTPLQDIKTLRLNFSPKLINMPGQGKFQSCITCRSVNSLYVVFCVFFVCQPLAILRIIWSTYENHQDFASQCVRLSFDPQD